MTKKVTNIFVTIIMLPTSLSPKYYRYKVGYHFDNRIEILITSLTCKCPSLILENNICWLSIRQIYITNISQLLPTFQIYRQHISNPAHPHGYIDVGDGCSWRFISVTTLRCWRPILFIEKVTNMRK